MTPPPPFPWPPPRTPAGGRSVFGDRRGAVSIETAILVPLLFLLVVGALDVARYFRTLAALDRAAVTAADLATKCQTIYAPTVNPTSPCNVQTIFKAAAVTAGDLGLDGGGAVILSSVGWYVTNPANAFAVQTVLWQQASGFTTPGAGTSVGKVNGKATLPAGEVLPTAHNVIVAEVFYSYRPWSTLTIFQPVIARSAVFRPRYTTDLRTITTS
ncbi:hypothetical protein AZL_001350 [Azospirillum sp. B510]|uniref:TadE/TadG family type IV pilus assembly protein n=1 Tax=Azospirillum sp. (strain B510) TaxID=137722 RepID=UPI0001C4BA89|nr:TadE/TadG family type IV pilus assembly protein [Azospirillum sp. B510]BAI70773.1 hypothetical protein AZL_001350 [Azospirillum sp. B510]